MLKRIFLNLKNCYDSTGTKFFSLSSQEKALPPPMKFLAHTMSQNMDSGTGSSSSSDGSQVSKYMLEAEDHQLAISDASDTMNFWNNRVNIYDKLSLFAQDILAVPASQRWKGLCCVLPAYCWSQKQNDQVIANVSLFETEQIILANTGINASVWTLVL